MTDEERAELIALLTAYITPGARNASVDEDYVKQCVSEAASLVGQAIGAATIPDEARTRAIVECGSELFNRRQAPSGITQYAAPDGGQIRLARDPMTSARTILAPYLPLGFA